MVKYDGSFEGFLTAVFDIYERRMGDVLFSGRMRRDCPLFANVHEVRTNSEIAGRVIRGLRQKISRGAIDQVYRTWLSELPEADDLLLRYLRYVLGGKAMAEYNYAYPAVLRVQQVAKMVYREKHRMEAFVRFQLTADQVYYALVEPDFDVLPLIEKHFRDRYADQRWIIYDSRRKYGLYYDLESVAYITLHFDDQLGEGKNIKMILDPAEDLFQRLWQQYFNSVNIAARKNTKLHLAHMPRRYWRYLPEKGSGGEAL